MRKVVGFTKENFKEQQIFSEFQFNEHWKLYQGYVNNVNNASKYTPKISLDINGILLHELFFENVTIDFLKHDVSSLHNCLTDTFGSVDSWKAEFMDCAMNSKGWAIFGYEPLTQSYRNIIMDKHNEGLSIGFFPIVVLDMYEHAYFADYGSVKKNYVESFVRNFNWSIAVNRYLCALRIGKQTEEM